MQAKLHQSMVDNIICLMEGCINKDQALKVVYLQCLHKTWEGWMATLLELVDKISSNEDKFMM